MAIEWFDKHFKKEQDKNQQRQQEQVYREKAEKLKQQQKEIEELYERSAEKQREVIEKLKHDSAGK